MRKASGQELPNGRRAYIGMPADVDAEAVGAFLERHGLRRETTSQTLQWTGPFDYPCTPAVAAALKEGKIVLRN